MIKNEDKFKVVITLDAELITTTDGVTKDQICDLFFQDNAYGLKSIVVGKINDSSESDHDTEILWDTTQIEIKR